MGNHRVTTILEATQIKISFSNQSLIYHTPILTNFFNELSKKENLIKTPKLSLEGKKKKRFFFFRGSQPRPLVVASYPKRKPTLGDCPQPVVKKSIFWGVGMKG